MQRQLCQRQGWPPAARAAPGVSFREGEHAGPAGAARHETGLMPQRPCRIKRAPGGRMAARAPRSGQAALPEAGHADHVLRF